MQPTLSKGWFALTGILIVLELMFVYEAMIADIAGLQRIFGVFVGLAIVCFAALLYAASEIMYGWE